MIRAVVAGCVLMALLTGACVQTYDGVFANPCEETLDVSVFYGTREEVIDRPEPSRELIVRADLEPLAVTRVSEAFEDPGAEAMTVQVTGTETYVEVDGSSRRGAATGEFSVVIPASVCAES